MVRRRRRRRRKRGWGEDGVKLMRTPELLLGNGKAKLE